MEKLTYVIKEEHLELRDQRHTNTHIWLDFFWNTFLLFGELMFLFGGIDSTEEDKKRPIKEIVSGLCFTWYRASLL